MGVTVKRAAGRRQRARRPAGPRADDPRVVRTRAAVVEAARELFLRKGYAGTTMEEIAALAGLTKRTLYNNYADKGALFIRIVTDVMAFAETFARGVRQEFTVGVTAANLHSTLDDLGRRLALQIMRPEVVALRRLLIGEAREFPALGAKYFDRAPGQVLEALAAGFAHLGQIGLLRVADERLAAAQFAYLVVGEPLDRAMLVGTVPPREHVIARAREGVQTFLARFGPSRRTSKPFDSVTSDSLKKPRED
jgi:TetR/AcrR family transcriptional regulator, mexJK operon transcriptional repressor